MPKKVKPVREAGSFMVKNFSLVSIPVIVIIGFAISFFITRQTEDIMFKSYADVTSSNVKSFISAELIPKDFDEPMRGARYTKFNTFIKEHIINGDILKIKLWSDKGLVIYSDDQRLVGKTFPVKEDLEEALHGEATSEIAKSNDAVENRLDKEKFDVAIETYVPVQKSGSNKVLGAYEVYLSVEPVMAAVTRVRVLVFAGLIALYVLLVLIVWWASSLLIKQYSKLEDYSDTMQTKALTDELTSLNNRRFFDAKVVEEFRRSIRYNRPISLLMLDIDKFKAVNDQLGHQIGDEILAKTAMIIKANLRNVDIAARYGGEEFAIIMPETEGENALIVAERLRKAYLNILKEYRTDSIPLSLSLGLAEYPSSANTSEDLIAAADKALYYSKNKGRNLVSFYRDIPDEAKKSKRN